MSQTNESAYNFYILDKSSEQLQLTKIRQRNPIALIIELNSNVCILRMITLFPVWMTN